MHDFSVDNNQNINGSFDNQKYGRQNRMLKPKLDQMTRNIANNLLGHSSMTDKNALMKQFAFHTEVMKSKVNKDDKKFKELT